MQIDGERRIYNTETGRRIAMGQFRRWAAEHGFTTLFITTRTADGRWALVTIFR